MMDSFSPSTPRTGPIRRSASHRPVSGGIAPNLADLNSPMSTRSGRTLARASASANVNTAGTNRGKTGPGYSPYARKSVVAAPSPHTSAREQGAERSHGRTGPKSLSAAVSNGGIVSALKGLPSKAFGYLFRAGGPSASQSMHDLRSIAASQDSDDEHEDDSLEPDNTGDSSSRPNADFEHRRRPSILGPAARSKGSNTSGLATTYSVPAGLSALSANAGGPRTSHSTLNLSHPSTTAPRAASPALSSTSRLRRSPSPARTRLAGSMSAFNFGTNPSSSSLQVLPLSQSSLSISGLAGPVSPTGSSSFGNSGTNGFGLTSRSPFTYRPPSPTRSTSSQGHSLFPFASNSSRGHAPGKRAFSVAASDLSGRDSGRMASPVRYASPLNPARASASTNASLTVQGDERIRKKQLVWDPEKGLISREALEREKAEKGAIAPLPKNEAERILEVLEGMGRTPVGEARREVSKNKFVSVPTPSSGMVSFVPRGGHVASPYTPRLEAREKTRGEGKGLSAVLRAREERRKRALEELRRVEQEEGEERARLQAMNRSENPSDQTDATEEQPRRKTRSMVKTEEKGKIKQKERVSTRPASTRAKSGKGKSQATQADAAKSLSMESRSKPVRKASRSPAPADPLPTASHSPLVTSQISQPNEQPSALDPCPGPLAQAIADQTGSTRDHDTVLGKKTAPAPSLRPGRTHTSRLHQASSRVFSAREEDLPPVDESELNKISLPAMTFPDGFSFGTQAKPLNMKTVTSGVASNAEVPTTSSLAARLTPISSADKLPSPTARVPIAGSQSVSASPSSKPSNLIPAGTTPLPIIDEGHKPESSFSAHSNFFAVPPITKSADISTSKSAKPDFFGAVLKADTNSQTSAPPVFPSFSVSTSKEMENKIAIPPNTSSPNPFSSFTTPSYDAANATATNNALNAPLISLENSANPRSDIHKPGVPFTTSTTLKTNGSGASVEPFTFSTQVKSQSFNAFSSTTAQGPSTKLDAAPFLAKTNDVLSIEGADEDSGMEDESGAAQAESQPGKPTFSFSLASPASSTTVPASNASAVGSHPLVLSGFSTSVQSTDASSASTISPFKFGVPSSGEGPVPSTGSEPSFGFGGKQESQTPSVLGPFSSGTGSVPFTFGSNTASKVSTSPFTMSSNPVPTGAALSPFSSTSPVNASPFGTAPTNNPFSTNAPSMSSTLSAPSFGAASSAGSPFGASKSNGFSFGGAGSQPTTPSVPSFQFGAGTEMPNTAFSFGPTTSPGQSPFGGNSSAPFNFGAGGSAPGTPIGVTAAFNIGAGGGDESGKRKIAPLRRRRG